MKTALILQPHGLGDCIFAQGVACHFKSLGYRIVWPVNNFLDDLRRAYTDITWCREDFTDIDTRFLQDALVVPIRYSDRIMNTSYDLVMRAKYDMYTLDWRNWHKNAMWERDRGQEQNLYDLLNYDNKQYRLIFNLYTGQFKYKRLPIPHDALTNIHVKPSSAYSLFDWAKVIENAREIHAVASSNIYLFELLDLKAKNIYIYPRDVPHHRQYDYIMRRHSYSFIVNN